MDTSKKSIHFLLKGLLLGFAQSKSTEVVIEPEEFKPRTNIVEQAHAGRTVWIEEKVTWTGKRGSCVVQLERTKKYLEWPSDMEPDHFFEYILKIGSVYKQSFGEDDAGRFVQIGLPEAFNENVRKKQKEKEEQQLASEAFTEQEGAAVALLKESLNVRTGLLQWVRKRNQEKSQGV